MLIFLPKLIKSYDLYKNVIKTNVRIANQFQTYLETLDANSIWPL